jgi:hypothetical protein
MWFIEDALTPAAILAAAGVFAILSGWSAGRTRTAVIGFLMLVLGAASFGIDAMILTERERLETELRQLCDDFRFKRAGTLDYFATPALKAMVTAALALVTVEDAPRITDVRTEITNQGSRAQMHFRANATIKVGGDYAGYQPTRFRLTWSREPDGWKIINVTRLHPRRTRNLASWTATRGDRPDSS